MCVKMARTVYEANLARFQTELKAKLKAEGGSLTRDSAKVDLSAYNSMCLFPSASGNPNRPRTVELFEVPAELPPGYSFGTPRNLADYRQIMLYLARTRENKPFLDLSVIKPVSQELLVSTLYAVRGTDCASSLNLSFQTFEPEALQLFQDMLAVNHYMEALTVTNCDLSPTSGKFVARGLKRMVQARSRVVMSLTRKNTGASRQASLAGSLGGGDMMSMRGEGATPQSFNSGFREPPSLRYLDLSGNQLGDEGVCAVLGAIQNFSELEYLALSNTQAKENAVGMLCDILYDSPKLVYVDISDNPGIGKSAGSLLLHTTRSLPRIRALCCRGTGMTSRQQKMIEHSITRNNCVCEALEDLIQAAVESASNKMEWQPAHARLAPRPDRPGQNPRRPGESESQPAPPVQELVRYKSTITAETFSSSERQQEISRRLLSTRISFQDVVFAEICKVLAESSPAEKPRGKYSGSLQSFAISQSETIGRRPEMEDFTLIQQDFGAYRRSRPNYRGSKGSTSHKEILLAIFDGHGGSECSSMVGQLFPIALADTINAVLYAAGLSHACKLPDKIWEPLLVGVFLRVDDTVRIKDVPSGSTGVMCLILDTRIITANVGDSRAVLTRDEAMIKAAGVDPDSYRPEAPVGNRPSGPEMLATDGMVPRSARRATDNPATGEVADLRAEEVNLARTKAEIFESDFSESESRDASSYASGATRLPRRKKKLDDIALRLSKDHKPDLPEETKRIEAVGGYVHAGRVLACLAVSRSFGDFAYKPSVSCVPYVSVYHLKKYDAWLAIACDGCWDVIRDVDAAVLLSTCLSAQTGALKLRDEAYKLESQDNISVVCIRLYID